MLVFYTIWFLLFASSLFPEEAKDCARCHGMETLAARTQGGGVRSFFIHPGKFDDSYHKELKCTECHSKGLEIYPHRSEALPSADCLHCHGEKKDFWDKTEEKKALLSKMKDIETEYRVSIHSESNVKCETCHNPHEFNLDLEREKGLDHLIKTENELCLNCHLEPRKWKSFRKEDAEPKDYRHPFVVHAWLPSRELHWEKVRCLDCHSSYSGTNLSHHIQKKEKAVRDCKSCHSNDSILKDKLYKMALRQEKNKSGLMNTMLWNEAYIIGATRNFYLDLLSSLSFGLGFLVMAFHGFMRYKTSKRMEGKSE